MKLHKKAAFISRNLGPRSVFRRTLEDADVKVSGQSLIEFEAISFKNVPEADWIFFYSPRALRFFFQQIGNELPEQIQFAAIGPSTAQEVMTKAGPCAFVGTGDPDTTAQAFLKVAAGCKVLFPQARHSRQSVQKQLGDAIDSYSLVVYDNRPVSEVPSLWAEVLVFTSPLSARTYLNHQEVKTGQHVVAIGQPTAVACQAAGASPLIAAAPSEAALAKIVLDCLKSKGEFR